MVRAPIPRIALAVAACLVAAPAARADDQLAVTHPVSETATAIALLDPAGGPLRTLGARTGCHDAQPAFSPDGRLIAFSRTTDRWRSFHVYVMRADGSGARRLTDGVFDDHPAFAPDGGRIAFSSLRRHAREQAIFVVATTGGRPRPVRGSDRGIDPEFTADGRHVVYEQDGSIVISRVDGSRRRRLGRGGAPAVSPDGTRIAFDSVRRGHHGLYVLDVSTRGVRHIKDRAIDPAWRPAG